MNNNRTKPVTIIISHWVDHPYDKIQSLVKQVSGLDQREQCNIVVVCNGGDKKGLNLPSEFSDISIINRENEGYNLGAWDAGWKLNRGSDYYLFLQSECVIRKTDALDKFLYRMENDKSIGLIGEAMNWDRMGLDFVRQKLQTEGKKTIVADMLLDRRDKGIIGPHLDASHLQSLIWFVRGDVLEKTQGIPHSSEKGEAVFNEVLFSKLVEMNEYRICQLSHRKFSTIGHPQWMFFGKIASRIRPRIKRIRRRFA